MNMCVCVCVPHPSLTIDSRNMYLYVKIHSTTYANIRIYVCAGDRTYTTYIQTPTDVSSHTYKHPHFKQKKINHINRSFL